MYNTRTFLKLVRKSLKSRLQFDQLCASRSQSGSDMSKQSIACRFGEDCHLSTLKLIWCVIYLASEKYTVSYAYFTR